MRDNEEVYVFSNNKNNLWGYGKKYYVGFEGSLVVWFMNMVKCKKF